MADVYLIEFKGSRKDYFLNTFYHNLTESEYVVTQSDRGEDIGQVQMKIESDRDVPGLDHPRSILRRASREDLERHQENQQNDITRQTEIIEIIERHGLLMKVVDVETQHDGNKMTVFFTADQRVDFRELVKELASCYKTRIELRQIGVRDEARRIGGFGICGLRQCCSSFIKDFLPISTQHAREQDLPMNPAKISGNCGRLLCCLRFENEAYRKCKKMFPQPGKKIQTKQGEGTILRIDVFNEEAIIKDEENLTFRAKIKDILSVDDMALDSKAVVTSTYEESSESEDEVAQLEKLDESDTEN